MDAQKPRRGRPPVDSSMRRVSFHFLTEAKHEVWLNEEKARTGLSWGEIIDRLVEREVADVEQA